MYESDFISLNMLEAHAVLLNCSSEGHGLFCALGASAVAGWMFWFEHIGRRPMHTVVPLLGCSESCTTGTSITHLLFCASHLLITHLLTG
jgi:hypothetical protein